MGGVMIFPDGEVLLTDLARELRVDVHEPIALGACASDDADGEPGVIVAVPLPSGEYAVADVDLGLVLTACEAFVAVHGDPRRRGRAKGAA